MNPEITFHYANRNHIGYGIHALSLDKYLQKIGVRTLRGFESPDEITNTVCWVAVPSHADSWKDGQHVAIYTMWEGTRVPETFLETLAEFHTVIVPSHDNLRSFSEHHDNVHLCLEGIDPDDWYYVERTPPSTEFRFLFSGAGERKGGDLALKAFKLAFPTPPEQGPIPTLYMKAKNPEPWMVGDNVKLVTGVLDQDDLLALYETAHCYVQPSRGEGFGLQPMQAMAQGCPTILTDAHGHASFAHLGIPIPATLTKAGYFIYGDAGQWWEPDLDALVEAMRDVYFNYEDALLKAKISAEEIAEHWTWETTARRFLEILHDPMTTPYTGSGKTVTPTSSLYPVRVSRPWGAEIAGQTYYFTPGTTYYERADVKRAMMDLGVLHPDCMNEGGLHPEQVRRIAGESAANAYCPTCHQRLNSQPTAADDLLEAVSHL